MIWATQADARSLATAAASLGYPLNMKLADQTRRVGLLKAAGGSPGLGAAGAPAVTPATFGLVVAVALGIAAIATLVLASRAARTSTVAALADAARPPHR